MVARSPSKWCRRANGVAEIANGLAEIANGLAEIANGVAEITNAMAKPAVGIAQVDDRSSKLEVSVVYDCDMKTFTAIVERDPDTKFYVGYVPSFPGAHSQGTTFTKPN